MLVARDRDHPETARVLRADFVDHVLGHNEIPEIDPAHMRLGGATARNIIRGNDSLPNENVDHAFLAVGIGPGLVDLTAGNEADIAQKVENMFFVRGWHWRLGTRAT